VTRFEVANFSRGAAAAYSLGRQPREIRNHSGQSPAGQRCEVFPCSKSSRLGPLSRPNRGVIGRDNGPILRSKCFTALPGGATALSTRQIAVAPPGLCVPFPRFPWVCTHGLHVAIPPGLTKPYNGPAAARVVNRPSWTDSRAAQIRRSENCQEHHPISKRWIHIQDFVKESVRYCVLMWRFHSRAIFNGYS